MTQTEPGHRDDKAASAPDTSRAVPRGDATTDEGNAAWNAPWLANPEHPQGAADQRPPPQTSTGHYGPGYSDPTRHFGDTLPGRPGTSAAPERVEGEGGAIAGDAPEAGEVASPDTCPTPAAPAIEPR